MSQPLLQSKYLGIGILVRETDLEIRNVVFPWRYEYCASRRIAMTSDLASSDYQTRKYARNPNILPFRGYQINDTGAVLVSP